jgi:hypothetical protein
VLGTTLDCCITIGEFEFVIEDKVADPVTMVGTLVVII